MSNTVQPSASKEKFTTRVNIILQEISPDAKDVSLGIADGTVHRLNLSHYEEFIHSDSKVMETTTYRFDTFKQGKGYVDPKDIRTTGYLPKDYNPRDPMKKYTTF